MENTNNSQSAEKRKVSEKKINLSLPDWTYTFRSRLKSLNKKKQEQQTLLSPVLTVTNSSEHAINVPQTWEQLNARNFLTEIAEEDNNLKMTAEETKQYTHLYNCKQIGIDIIDLQRSKGKVYGYQQTEFNKTKFSDEKAFNEFYNKLHKSTSLYRKGGTSISTPSFNFIRNAQHFRIIPKPVGIVKRKGDAATIVLPDYRLGDDYVTCWCNSLKISDHITEINWSKNRWTDLSLIPLSNTWMGNESWLKRIVNLNISYNIIGVQGTDALANYLSSSNCGIEYLNIEALNLGVERGALIIDSIWLQLTGKIRYLNLGINNLDDILAEKLGELIKQSEYLNVLILFQNRFRNHGAAVWMSEIKNHIRLKILDISWNLIGDTLNESLPSHEEIHSANESKKQNDNSGNQKSTIETTRTSLKKKLPPIKKTVTYFAKELCELFHNKETEMIHLDISYNSINCFDAAAISEAVKFNHTILGIHVDGNDMEIDELGFITPWDKTKYKPNHFAKSQIYYRISNNHPLIKCNIINGEKIRGKNNCWICEGWKEIKFNYKSHNNEDNWMTTDVKLHLNFEDYKPYDTVLRKDTFICHRMCPPGQLYFYFTMNGVPVENYGAMTQEWKDAWVYKQPIKEDDLEDEVEESEWSDKEPKQFIITKIAQTQVAINPEVISSTSYLKMIKYCEPRPEKKVNLKKRPRTPWSYPISLWAHFGYLYEGDNESSIDDAFDFDFKRGQYSNDKDLTQEMVDELRVILRVYYPKILYCYKNWSAYWGWKIWQIGQNQITEFANSCPNLLDIKYVINDVLVKVTEVKSNFLDKEARKNNQNIPDNIIRHQFLMLWYKISKDKYFRTKQMASVPEAVRYSFENHFKDYINQFDNHKWRLERYYNEDVDNVLKAFIPWLDAVFYSQATQKIIGRKDSHWMWLEEFTNVVNALMDSEFPVKEIPIIFNLSMRLQKNEIDSDKHYNMTFPEFLEAFSRFVDKLSPIPPGENKSEWDMAMRMDQPLSVKLETIMPGLFSLIKNPIYKHVKDKFQFPARDDETGWLKVDPTNQFYVGKLPPPKPKVKRKSIIAAADEKTK